MRILHVLHHYLPEYRGGVETHVATLAGAQLAAGHRVRVFTGSNALRDPSAPAPPNEVDGVPVVRVPFRTEFERHAAGTREGLDAFEALLDRDPPDLVHLHHFSAVGPGAVRAAERRGVPTVVSMHDLYAICPLTFRLRRDRDLCAPEVPPATCIDCITEVSGGDRDEVASAFATREREFAADLAAAAWVLAQSRTQLDYLKRVPLLADTPVTTIGLPGPPEPEGGPLDLYLPDLPLHVATWGGLARGKGLHLLVDAARSLQPDAIQVHHHGPLVDLAYRDEILAGAGHVEVTFHGPYAPGELRERLRGCDLAVHPSLYLETYGLVTDEALRLGLPVIVPDRGAPKERIGRLGLTFRVGEPADLARQLARFVEAPERLLALRAGKPGPLLDLGSYLESLDSIYRAALGKRG